MNDESNVGFVDSHSKSRRRYNHLSRPFKPPTVHFGPSVWVEIGVVRLGLDADGSKRVGDGVRVLLREAVNDSGLIGEPGFDGVGDVLNRFHGFAFLLTDFVEEIPSVVSRFEQKAGGYPQDSLHVFDDGVCGGGGQPDYGCIWKLPLHHIEEFVVWPKIVAPLGTAMDFIYGDPRKQAKRVGFLELVHELLALRQSLGGDVKEIQRSRLVHHLVLHLLYAE